jgi:hypothetical protein
VGGCKRSLLRFRNLNRFLGPPENDPFATAALIPMVKELLVPLDFFAGQSRATAAQEQDHFRTLKELGVDLTAFLTQSRADRVIELRGNAPAHVHLDNLDVQPANGHSALAD